MEMPKKCDGDTAVATSMAIEKLGSVLSPSNSFEWNLGVPSTQNGILLLIRDYLLHHYLHRLEVAFLPQNLTQLVPLDAGEINGIVL